MWKVHLPAKSYLQKQVKTYGSQAIINALYAGNMLLKSGFLHYRGSDGTGQVHNWAPPEAINEDPETPDHPPWSHNPETGELHFNEDGTPFGLHGIDYIHRDLQGRFGMDPKESEAFLNSAIQRYNDKHKDDSNHKLPPFASNQHRKVFVGDFIHKDTPTEERQIRGEIPLEGGPRPLITYSMNMGNVDHEHADKGAWIDGWHNHFRKEIKEEFVSRGVQDSDYKHLPYINYPVIKPNLLTDNLVVSWNKIDTEKAKHEGIPRNYLHDSHRDDLDAQRAHGDIHFHQMAHILPDVFYHAPTSNAGGRPKKVKLNEAGEPIANLTDGQQLAQTLQEANIDASNYSPEDLEAIGSTLAMQMMFTRTHTQGSKKGAGAAKNALNDIFSKLGSDHTSERYKLHRSNALAATPHETLKFHKSTNHRAADIAAHISNLAEQYKEKGMDEQMALKHATEKLRNYTDRGVARRGHVDGLREKTEALINTMMGKTGHEPLNLGSIADKHVHSGLPKGMGTSTEVPEHWKKRIVGTSDLAPVGNSEGAMPYTQQKLPFVAPAPQPQPQPQPQPTMSQPMIGQRRAAPFEERYMQQLGVPQQQTFWDVGSGALVQRSDVKSDLSDIMKRIEAVQVKDAMQDGDIMKMIPTRSASLSSQWDLLEIAKGLGVTTVDIHGIYHSEGDWHRVAKEWNVKPSVVKAIKVAFRGN